MEKNKEQKDVEKRIVLQGSVEYNAEDKPPVIKGGIEENVIVKLPEIDVSEIEIGFESLLKDKGNSIDDLIADNKTEIAYLKTKQREQELEIKNRQENVKRLQEQKKAIRREERERQKLYNALKSDNIGLTKINVTANKTSNYHPLVENVEPLIKSKQNQLVNQDEQNRSKNEYRASLFYPDDAEETKLYLEKQKKVAEEQKREQKAQLEKQIEARKNVKTLPISDVEKTLFPHGNLAEMDFAKSKELGEKINSISKDLEKIFKYKKKLPTREQIYEMIAYSLQNQEETKSAKTQFWMDFKNGHIIDNAFAINFIQNIGFRNYSIGEIGKEAAENLYMAKKEYYMNTPYAREHQIFNNCYELEPRLRDYFIEKIIQQIGSDKLETIKGIYIDTNSQSSKELAKNFDLQKKVSEHVNLLKKGQIIEIDRNMRFKTGNFYYAINNADILDLHINKQGNIDLLVVDTYDFNKNDSNDLVKLAREHQDRGDLVPYFIIYHVIIPIIKIK